jgi:hypothetical protein
MRSSVISKYDLSQAFPQSLPANQEWRDLFIADEFASPGLHRKRIEAKQKADSMTPMKTKTPRLILAFSLAARAVCLAANPQIGT